MTTYDIVWELREIPTANYGLYDIAYTVHLVG